LFIKIDGINDLCYIDKKFNSYFIDEIADEAIKFIHIKFLQRDVSIKVSGKVDKELIVSVKLNDVDLGEDLLKNGFVRINAEFKDLSIRPTYEAAETVAKNSNLRLWKNYDPEKEAEILKKKKEREEFLKKRIENCVKFKAQLINYRDTTLTVTTDGVKKTIILANIVPLSDYNPTRDYLMRIFMRKILKGTFLCKKCFENSGEIDGEKYLDEFYDVIVDGNNLQQMLLENGYVSLYKERNEERRSFDYNKLLEVKRPNKKFNDITIVDKINIKKYKDLKEFHGIVMAVLSPTRIKVFSEKDFTEITIVVNGVRNSKESIDDPGVKEGRIKLSEYILYQDVDIYNISSLENCFIGDILYGDQRLDEWLAKKGYVMPVKSSSQEVIDCVNSAKTRKLGIWKSYDEAAEEEKRKAREEEYRKKREEDKKKRQEIAKTVHKVEFETAQVKVVGIDENLVYYYTEDKKNYLDEVTEKIHAFCKSKRVAPKFEVNEVVIVTVNKKEYRATITSITDKINSKLIDTGKEVSYGKSKYRQINEDLKNLPVEIKSVKPLGIQFVRQGELFFDECTRIVEETLMKANTLKFISHKERVHTETEEKTEKPVENIVKFGLFYDGETNIFNDLLLNGYLSIALPFKWRDDWAKEMILSEAEARKEKKNIWLYGELDDKLAEQIPKKKKAQK